MVNAKRKMDRRTQYTINVIKDSLLTLVEEEPYARVTVAQLCQRADISRSTFYLHFDSLTDVLNSVLDDALLLADNTRMIVDKPLDYLKDNESLLPVCQRIGQSPKYQTLLMDPDLSEYIIGRIISSKRDEIVPLLKKKTGLSSKDAETLFTYMIHGSFAINRAHHFIKDSAWAHDVELLNRFTAEGLKNIKD